VQILAANPAPRTPPPDGGGGRGEGGRDFGGRGDLGALASAFLGGGGGMPLPGGFGGNPTQVTEGAINQAQTILTSAQLGALQQIQQQQQAQQQLQQLVRGAMEQNAPPRGGDGAPPAGAGPPRRR
jgi:hypothetical protein